MIALSVLVSNVIGAANAVPLEGTLPLHLVGRWQVEVGAGSLETPAGALKLTRSVIVNIDPPERRLVADEVYPILPAFNPKAGGWRKGARLQPLITQECCATGLLVPETLVIKPAPGNAAPFRRGVDYDLDPFWGTVGRIDGGAIGERQPVYVDYSYRLCRLDSIVVNASGAVRLIRGIEGVGAMLPPPHEPNEHVVANIWLPGDAAALSAENLFPIERGRAPLGPPPTAERLLPKTIAKLRAGERVLIVAWGDSVTNGGGIEGDTDLWYQHQFAALLRQRFPKADIELRTAAWGGSSSRRYMDEPPGGEHDFVRDVLDPQPDLVTIEFVNDAYLNAAGVAQQYGEIAERIRGVGAELILITPHLVRPDWMNVDTLKFDYDPRPYVIALRNFAHENNIAVAEASAKWCRLWRQGIPYVTLLANSINHPDARGHAIFAEALMEVFPEK